MYKFVQWYWIYYYGYAWWMIINSFCVEIILLLITGMLDSWIRSFEMLFALLICSFLIFFQSYVCKIINFFEGAGYSKLSIFKKINRWDYRGYPQLKFFGYGTEIASSSGLGFMISTASPPIAIPSNKWATSNYGYVLDFSTFEELASCLCSCCLTLYAREDGYVLFWYHRFYINTFPMFEFQFMPNFHQTKRSFSLLICKGQVVIILFW